MRNSIQVELGLARLVWANRVVDSHRRSVAVCGDLKVHHEIKDLNVAQPLNRFGDPSKQRRHILLAGTSRVRLGKMPRGPVRGDAHVPMMADPISAPALI